MMAQNLKKNTEYTEMVLIGLLTDDDNASGFDRTLFNENFRVGRVLTPRPAVKRR